MEIRATLALSVMLLAAACGGSEPSEGDVAAAGGIYSQCAADLGVEVERVEIAPGVIDVDLAEGADAADVARVEQECEPLAMAALEDGGEPSGSADTLEVPAGVSDIEEYLAQLRSDDFSGVVLVERAGELTAQGFGLADRDAREPNDLDTAFDIGSIAKTFTAVTVLRLVDAGELGLDDTLGGLLADVPADKRDITVRQLLDFSSGLGEYHDTEGDFEPMTRQQARDAILGQELLFEPGTDTAYSNSSYTLSAMVVEEVTGRTFTDLVREVIEAAGLTATDFYGSETLQAVPVAIGYEGGRHGENDPTTWEATWALLGSGGLVSTAPDLETWWREILQPGLLSTDAVDVLREAFLPTTDVGGTLYRGVGGTNDFGFDAVVAEAPDHEVLVVVLTNANPPDRTLANRTGFVLAQLATGADA